MWRHEDKPCLLWPVIGHVQSRIQMSFISWIPKTLLKQRQWMWTNAYETACEEAKIKISCWENAIWMVWFCIYWERTAVWLWSKFACICGSFWSGTPSIHWSRDVPHRSRINHPCSWDAYGDYHNLWSWASGDEEEFLKMLACQNQILAECYGQ